MLGLNKIGLKFNQGKMQLLVKNLVTFPHFINGFKAAGVSEAVDKANEAFHRIENPFIVY